MAISIRPQFTRPPWAALEGTILENQSTTTDGGWFPILGYYPLTVSVEGTFNGKVKIFVSNAEEAPANNADDCSQLGSDFIGDGTAQNPGAGNIIVQAAWRWIRAAAILTSGTVRSVNLYGTGPMVGPRMF